MIAIPSHDANPSRPGLAWWFMAIPATLIALYAFSYLVLRDRMFPSNIAASFQARPWGIYSHVLFGGLALALGPFQFRRSLLVRRRSLHRRMGKVYVISALLTGTAGLYMSFYSFGGAWTHAGFGLLALGLITTTALAWIAIRAGDVATHREWIIRSFALLFAAVTLRIELPLLIMAFKAFTPAYRIVSWLCWVPNALWAELRIARTRRTETPVVRALRAA